MKLKSIILVSLFSFLLIPSFSSADNVYVEDVPSDFVIGNYSYSVDNNLNFTTNSTGKFIEYKYTPSYNQFYHFFGWINKKLYYVSYDIQQVQGYIQGRQGFINNFCATNDLTNRCTNFNVSAEVFYSMRKNITKIAIGIYGNDYQNPFGLCFYNSLDELYYCAYGAYATHSSIQYSSLTGSIGFSSESEIRNYDWGSSSYYSPDTFYYSTGSCPSVGQLKRGSNLNPAICYAGYDGDLIYTAGENTIIQAGSGLNIFETYALFSGQMNIQNWYDTYWTYYNNISFNPYPFYNKPKALLGLMVARQMGSMQQCGGSYSILNYCWYVLNDFPDNANTCVVPNILSQYPGINITAEDNQCVIDSINDDYTIHRPGTGSIFDGAPDGGGRSWGDEECNGIPCLFEKFYQMFTSSRINDVDFSDGGQGILPQYIALAFVVVVLFYVFKR